MTEPVEERAEVKYLEKILLTADQIHAWIAELAPQVSRELLVEVLDLVPDPWLEPVPGAEDLGALPPPPTLAQMC